MRFCYTPGGETRVVEVVESADSKDAEKHRAKLHSPGPTLSKTGQLGANLPMRPLHQLAASASLNRLGFWG